METDSIRINTAAAGVDQEATVLIRARYQRISPIYDRVEAVLERRFWPWRKRLWQAVSGPRVLEVGVGTGKNIEFWPQDYRVTAIDITPGMLEQARQRAVILNRREDDLFVADVQQLEFPSRMFDTAVATCVFCSVPDPIQGLREVRRVVRRNGQVLLLEHIRIDRPVIGPLMDILSPFVVKLYGASINRRTVENVRAAGLHIERIENLDRMGMFKLIFARAAA